MTAKGKVCVLHSTKENGCGHSKLCINPEHLRLGTQQENIQDREQDRLL